MFERATFLDLLALVSASPLAYATEAARLLARDMVADREGRGHDFRGRNFPHQVQAVSEVALPVDDEVELVSNGAGPRLAQYLYSYRRTLFPGTSIPFAGTSRVMGGAGNVTTLVAEGAAAGGGDYTTARAAWDALLAADEAEIENGRLRARFEVRPTAPRFRTRHIIQEFAYTVVPYVQVHVLAGDLNFRLYGRAITSGAITLNFDTTPFATVTPDAGEAFDLSTSITLAQGDVDVDLGGCPIAVLQVWQD